MAVITTTVPTTVRTSTRARRDPIMVAFRDYEKNSPVQKLPTPQCWKDAEAIIQSGHYRVLLNGIPGTGKTYAANHLPYKGEPCKTFNVYLGEETAAYQIVGTDIIRDGEMEWRDGPALSQRRKGVRLCINEIDHASGDALDALIWLTDDEETAAMGIDLPTGEKIYPYEDLQFVATMNGEREDLGDALSDRFVTTVRITCPHPDAVMQLPRALWNIAAKLSHEETPESQRITIRQFRSFATMMEEGVPSATAARGAFHRRSEELLKTIKLAAGGN
jgi:MoxR-like ATPase